MNFTSISALIIALTASTSAVAQSTSTTCDCPDQSGWTPSFVSGDPVDATEVRQFAVFGNPIALYAATGSWMDQGSPKGTAHIIRLDSSTAKWVDEADLGDGTTGGLVNLHWTADANHKAVDVYTLAASIWSGATVFAKNNSDGKWIRTNLDPNGQIRAFAVHEDAIAHEQFGFAGGKPGIFRGQLAASRPAGVSPITWTTSVAKVELNTASLNLPLCSGGGRVTGFAEARGKMFASACWNIYERVDGPIGKCSGPSQVEIKNACQARWKLFWTDPLAAQGESGLRGLTMVKHSGDEVLLVGSESGNMHMTRIDPDNGASVVEFNASTYLNNLWGLNSGYGILPYDAPANLWYGPDGKGRRMFGFEVWLPGNPTPGMARKLVNIDDGSPQVMNGEAFFFLRNSSSSYQLFHIPMVTPQPATAVRDMISSPFADECNEARQDCVVYAAYFDANKSTTQTPCLVAPCTFPPLEAVPTHATGAIVKGRIALNPAALAAPMSEEHSEKLLIPNRSEGD